jgi:hypothetical protein
LKSKTAGVIVKALVLVSVDVKVIASEAKVTAPVEVKVSVTVEEAIVEVRVQDKAMTKS